MLCKEVDQAEKNPQQTQGHAHGDLGDYLLSRNGKSEHRNDLTLIVGYSFYFAGPDES